MPLIPKLIMLGALLSVIQFLIGVDLFLRGWGLVMLHVAVAAILLAILIPAVLKTGEFPRVRRHSLITLVLLLIQGGLGIDMLTRGPTQMIEVLHWLFGALTTGSFLATLVIAKKNIP